MKFLRNVSLLSRGRTFMNLKPLFIMYPRILVNPSKLIDKLATVFVHVDDEYVLLYTLNGLPSEYNPFRTSIRTHHDTVPLDELHALLRYESKFIEQQAKAVSGAHVFNPTVMYI